MRNAIGKWARSFMPEVAEWRGEPVTAIEHKWDGHNYVLSNEGDGSFSALGRQVHVDNWDALDRYQWPIACLVKFLPPCSSVMGELWVPGKPATAVPSGFVGGERLHFVAYAAPIWEGEAVPFKDFGTVYRELMALGFGVPGQEPCPPGMTREEADAFKQTLLTRARANGTEGYVLKRAHMAGWYKVKPVKTADVVVTGWKPHLRREHQVGAFRVVAHDPRTRELVDLGWVGSGLTKADRESLRGDDCVGRVMEVEYQSVGACGGLQFPVFLRWRDDKPANECEVPR